MSPRSGSSVACDSKAACLRKARASSRSTWSTNTALSHLKTYQEAFAQYHLSCEGKFANGEFRDSGRSKRRHVVATELVLIGKEANRIGESGEADPIAEAHQVFRRKLA
jgi:hypothetical protein